MAVRHNYDLNRVLRLHTEIYELLMIDYNGCVFDGRHIDLLILDLKKLFPEATASTTLRECLTYLVGQRPTIEALEQLAWRLAGNVHRIVRRKPVFQWRGQSTDELLPAYIDQARPYITKAGKPGHIFRFKILAGLTAGMYVEQFWSDSFCRFISRDCGFARRGDGARYINSSQFVLLRFLLEISAEKSIDKPAFTSIQMPFPASLLSWNRSLLMRRLRLTPESKCPTGLEHDDTVPCHLCEIGFSHCPNATHRVDYVVGYCTSCHEPDRWINPEFDGTTCVRCLSRLRLKPSSKVSA